MIFQQEGRALGMVEYTGAVGCSPEKDDENVGDVLVRVLQGKVIIGDI